MKKQKQRGAMDREKGKGMDAPQSEIRNPKSAIARRPTDDTRARRRLVNLAKMPSSTGTVSLSVKLAKGEFSVDRTGNGSLKNVSVITRGPAQGHGFVVDDMMLQQVADALNASPKGTKSRLTHPKPFGTDPIFTRLGRTAGTARVEDGKVKCDLCFGSYAAGGPQGNLAKYVMDLADEDPSDLGLSISFEPDEYLERTGPDGLPIEPAGRLKALVAVDVVDDPGANPDGLLSSGTGDRGTGTGKENNNNRRADGTAGTTPVGEDAMKLNARQRAYLASCGLAADATDEQVQQFLKKLQPVQTTYLESLKDGDQGTGTGDLGKGKKPADSGAAGPTPEETLAADKQRRTAILALAAGENNPVSLDAARQWADDGVSLADAQRLAQLAKTLRPVPAGRVEGGQDLDLATLGTGIVDALLLRAGQPLMTFDPVTGLAERDAEGRIVPRKPCERALTMRRMPVPEMARRYLSAVGVTEKLANLSGEECVNVASGSRRDFPQRLRAIGGNIDLAMSTGDFPYLLADALNKVFLGGYNLAPSTWGYWCRRMTARDFKDVKLLNLSNAPAMQIRKEGGELVFGKLSESKETVALAEYVSGLIFTRRQQINDDLGVFQDGGAQRLGAIARYKEDDVVYAILTANAAMSDTGALFNNTVVTTAGGHANLSSGASTAVYAVTSAGQWPTVVTLFLESEQAPVLKQEVQWDTDDLKVAVRHTVAAKAADWRGMYKDVTGTYTVASLAAIVDAMVIQKDPSGAFMNLRPSFMLVPAGLLEVSWSQLIGSNVDPSKTNATPNPFWNKLTVIGEPRLHA